MKVFRTVTISNQNVVSNIFKEVAVMKIDQLYNWGKRLLQKIFTNAIAELHLTQPTKSYLGLCDDFKYTTIHEFMIKHKVTAK